MMFVSCVTILLLLVQISDSNISAPRLMKVYYVTRHGAKAPNLPIAYPNYINIPDQYPNGYNNVTDLGIRQCVSHGYSTLQRYQRLSGRSNLSKGDISLTSSNFTKTKVSAVAFLRGFEGQAEVGEKEIGLIKRLETLAEDNVTIVGDLFLSVAERCQRHYEGVLDNIYSFRSTLPALFCKYRTDLDYLAREAGYAGGEWQDFYICRIADPLYCDSIHDYTMPPFIQNRPELYHIIQEIYERVFPNLVRANDLLIKMGAGLLIDSIVEDMMAFGWRSTDQLIQFYSAHDYTIAILLTMLNVNYNFHPQTSSALAIELWEGGSGGSNDTVTAPDLIVKFFYKKDVHAPYREIKASLSLNRFGDSVQKYRVNDTNYVRQWCRTSTIRI